MANEYTHPLSNLTTNPLTTNDICQSCAMSYLSNSEDALRINFFNTENSDQVLITEDEFNFINGILDDLLCGIEVSSTDLRKAMILTSNINGLTVHHCFKIRHLILQTDPRITDPELPLSYRVKDSLRIINTELDDRDFMRQIASEFRITNLQQLIAINFARHQIGNLPVSNTKLVNISAEIYQFMINPNYITIVELNSKVTEWGFKTEGIGPGHYWDEITNLRRRLDQTCNIPDKYLRKARIVLERILSEIEANEIDQDEI